MARALVLCVVTIAFLSCVSHCQDLCDTFLSGNTVVVDRETLSDIDTRGASLQDLVDCVEDGGSVSFDVQSLQINETLQVTKSISFRSASQDASSLTCNRNTPIFEISALSVDIANLSIVECDLQSDDAPIVVLPGAGVALTGVGFRENVNTVGPAAIRLDRNSTIVVRDSYFGRSVGNESSALKASRNSTIRVISSVFEDNRGRGTIVARDPRRIVITRSSFLNNTALRFGGGAIRVNNDATDRSDLILTRSVFQRNSARLADGGAVLVQGNVSLTITNNTRFRGNSARRRGGAIAVRGSSSMSIESALFIENESNFTGGGAVYVENTTDSSLAITISNSLFARNSARNYLGSGGGLRLRGEGISCILENVSFVANSAQFDAAGLHVSHVARLNITGGSFVGNDALTGGSAALLAVSLERTGSDPMIIHVERSKFLFNRAFNSRRGGGALGAVGFGTEMRVDDCEFRHNDVGEGSGGAIYLFNGPTVEINNCTFFGNRAVWGGALYAENEAKYDLDFCDFERNTATEGGALHVRGDVDVAIDDCLFNNNSAGKEGGAIKLRNFLTSNDGLLKFVMRNSSVVDNEVGVNLFEDGLFGRETSGGGIFARGGGVDLEVVENVFERNQASFGGAVNVKAVADINFVFNRFENNTANFGGAFFLQVDEQVRPKRFPFYFINQGQFKNNSADLGGGVYIGSKAAVDGTSFNALVFMVRLIGVSFMENRATSGGGGLAMVGSGVEFRSGCTFQLNVAQAEEEDSVKALGGAVLVDNGAVLDCREGSFSNNTADAGGAAAVRDASLNAAFVAFSENMVFPGGVGGALSVEVSAEKDLPRLAGQNRVVGILFDCASCAFVRNNGSLRGGAVHLHHINPSTEISLPRKCTSGLNDSKILDDVLTCETRMRLLTRLRRRAIRFSGVTFEGNSADAGGALFTNDPGMIIIAANLAGAPAADLSTVLVENNETFLQSSMVSFIDNTNGPSGYGSDYASTPVIAILKDETRPNRRPSQNLTVNIVSGERLNFSVFLQDALGQNVSVQLNLTALIVYDVENSEGKQLEVAGQETAGQDTEGRSEFTGTRLRGLPNTEYLLRIDFRPNSDALTIAVPPSFITVRLLECRIGERTLMEGNVTECQECSSGTFTDDPREGTCHSCANIGPARCSGKTVTPEDHFWHVESTSLKIFRCVAREGCVFQGRLEQLRNAEEQAHRNGVRLHYVNDTNERARQCKTGYEGLLCGECSEGYGKENNRCIKCHSAGARGFLLFLIVIWSFAFLSFFLRSVLQLAERVEFNKNFDKLLRRFLLKARFKEAIPTEPSVTEGQPQRCGGPPQGEIAPDVEDADREQVLSPNTQQPSQSRAEATVHPTQQNVASTDTRVHEGTRVRSFLSRLNFFYSSQRQQQMTADPSAGGERPERLVSRRRSKLGTKLMNIVNQETEERIVPLTLANPMAEILKILVNFLQVTAVAATITLDWTKELRRVLVLLGIVSSTSSGSGFISLDCFVSSDTTPKSLQRMVITILFPLIVLAVYAVIWASKAMRRLHPIQYFTQRLWLTYLAINYFVYINMTKNLLRFFACAKISDKSLEKDLLVWEEDTAVACYERHHAAVIGGLILPLLFAVTLGFPFGTYVILRRNQNRLEDENFIATYGFLYRAYDAHYWEVVIMLRKGLIATIAVLSHLLGENVQGLLCVLVLVVALSLHLTRQPFTQEIPRLNQLETLSLLTTIFVFLAGLMMNDPKAGDNDRKLLTVLTLLAVCTLVIVMLFELATAIEEVIDMMLIETEVMDMDKIVEARLSEKLEVLALRPVRGLRVRMKAIKEERIKRKTNRTRSAATRTGNQTMSPIAEERV